MQNDVSEKSLDGAIVAILRELELPVSDTEFTEEIRETIETARRSLVEPSYFRPLPKRRQLALERRLARLRAELTEVGWLEEAHQRMFDELEQRMGLLQWFPAKRGPQSREWLQGSCLRILDALTNLSLRMRLDLPLHVSERGVPSLALSLLERCTQLVDPTVNRSAIRFVVRDVETSFLFGEDWAAEMKWRRTRNAKPAARIGAKQA